MSYSSIQSTPGLRTFDYRQTPELRTPAGPKYPTTSGAELENGLLASGSMEYLDWGKMEQATQKSNPMDFFKTFCHCPIHIWDTNTGMHLQTLNGHSHLITALVPLKNGTLASASADKTIKLWDVHKEQCIQTLNVSDEAIGALAVLDEDKIISVSLSLISDESKDRNIRLWDLRKGQCLQTWKRDINSTPVLSSTALLRNRTLACGVDYNVHLLDLNTGKFCQTLHGHSGFILPLAAVGEHLVASGSVDKTIKIWDIRTGQCLKTLIAYEDIRILSVFKSRILASCSGEKTVQLWDVNIGECLQTLPDQSHSIQLSSLIMLKNGGLVTTAETLNIWKFPERPLTPQEEAELREEQFADDLSHLKLSLNKPHPNPIQIEEEFKKYELDAFNYKSIDFYLTRARFHDNSAQTEKSAVRKKKLLESAREDYDQAMKFNLYAEGAAERIEAIDNELYPKLEIPQFGIPPQGTFSSVPASAASFPSRNVLTPEQQAKVEAMKQQMLKGLYNK